MKCAYGPRPTQHPSGLHLRTVLGPLASRNSPLYPCGLARFFPFFQHRLSSHPPLCQHPRGALGVNTIPLILPQKNDPLKKKKESSGHEESHTDLHCTRPPRLHALLHEPNCRGNIKSLAKYFVPRHEQKSRTSCRIFNSIKLPGAPSHNFDHFRPCELSRKLSRVSVKNRDRIPIASLLKFLNDNSRRFLLFFSRIISITRESHRDVAYDRDSHG